MLADCFEELLKPVMSTFSAEDDKKVTVNTIMLASGASALVLIYFRCFAVKGLTVDSILLLTVE
jgi:hypothetical protein